MNERLRVLCVDDSEDLRDLLIVAIGAEPDMESVGALDCADDLVGQIAALRPHVVLMDLTMPGRDPLDAMKEAADKHPDSRTVVLSGYDDPERVALAADHGAWGFLPKDAPLDRMFDAIRTVARGEVVFWR